VSGRGGNYCFAGLRLLESWFCISSGKASSGPRITTLLLGADVRVMFPDGLKGLPGTISAIWPRTTVRTRVWSAAALRYASQQH
jgi:hypothetical protein